MRASNYYADKETGNHYAMFRDCYDPATGRFCQADPVGSVLFGDIAFLNSGTLGLIQPKLASVLYRREPRYNHLYAYVRGNPLSYIDPTGLIVVCSDLDPNQCIDTNEIEDPHNQKNAMCKVSCNIKWQFICGGLSFATTAASRNGLVGGAIGLTCVLIKASDCSSYCDNLYPPCEANKR